MKPLKILYYSSHPGLNLTDRTGYGTHMREVIHAFREKGHEVRTVIMGGDSPRLESATSDNSTPSKTRMIKDWLKKLIPGSLWERIKISLLLRNDNKFYQKLLKEIEAFQPDMIYERASFMQISGVLAAKNKGIFHVLEMNAPYLEEQIEFTGHLVFEKEALKIEKQQFELSSAVCVVSSALKNQFEEKHQLPADKIIVTPNAINLDKIETDPERVAQIRNQYRLEDKKVLGFVGSIFPWHGVDLIIKAMARLGDEFPNLRLLIVGDGEIREQLEQLRDSNQLQDKVIFTGSVDHRDVFNFIKNMDITIMARSNWYGSPVKIFEYGAMGKVIIAPDNIPVKDVMVPGEDGLLVHDSVDELTKAIRTLLEDEDLSNQLAQNFYNKVIKNHVWSKVADDVLALRGIKA